MRRMRIVSVQRIIAEDVETPVIEKDGVLIEVKYCGVCGTDIRAFYGEHPFISFPIVLGHECSGIIAEAREIQN